MSEMLYGNIFDSKADVLVNPVNIVGVMGKGLALDFRKAYPAMHQAYMDAYRQGELKIGRMHVWKNPSPLPFYIINFPTKAHWRDRSSLPIIKEGLKDLVKTVESLGVGSIAIPPLGSGLGGLDWKDVRPLIEDTFANFPELEVQVFGQAA